MPIVGCWAVARLSLLPLLSDVLHKIGFTAVANSSNNLDFSVVLVKIAPDSFSGEDKRILVLIKIRTNIRLVMGLLQDMRFISSPPCNSITKFFYSHSTNPNQFA